MSIRFPETIVVPITQTDIDEADCKDPHNCMLQRGVKRFIGGHGYVKVDCRGVSITRRPDYREHAVLPKAAYKKMALFDKDKSLVKPFTITLHFHKTTKIKRSTDEQRAASNSRRKALLAAGKLKKYDPTERYTGFAFSGAPHAA